MTNLPDKKRKANEFEIISKRNKNDFYRQTSTTLNNFNKTQVDFNLEPAEYPFNKDGYRYIFAEPDPNAPFASQFHGEDNSWLAGKPIPPFLYRMYVPSYVTLSLNDRAHQLKVFDNKLMVSGDKGYSLIRSTHGVNNGTWYFECKIIDIPENSATRIGWSQQYSNLQAPLGYDKFGYSWRSKRGTIFHQSKGIHFNKDESSYKTGDTLGFFIHLPSINNDSNRKYLQPLMNPNEPNAIQFYNQVILKTKSTTPSMKNIQPWKDYLPILDESCKNSPLVKFKGYFYFEQKENIELQNKRLKPLPGSILAFYKNGKLIKKKTIFDDYKTISFNGNLANQTTIDNGEDAAFKDIFFGTYFPAISLYYNSSVQFNPGPNFEYPPSEYPFKLKPKPISDLTYHVAAQQTLNDLLYFITNKEKLII